MTQANITFNSINNSKTNNNDDDARKNNRLIFNNHHKTNSARTYNENTSYNYHTKNNTTDDQDSSIITDHHFTNTNNSPFISTSLAMPDPHHASSPTDRTNSNEGKTNNNDSDSSNPKTHAAFVNKLYRMVEDQSIQHLISWSPNGDLFSVANPTAFSKLVLPQYFKHNNWQSFVRQLNMYGFHKVNDMIHSNLTSESQKWEFRHQNFRRGAVEELQNIKRKSAKSHHQYLPSNMTMVPVASSSMGRLLLGSPSHPPQRQQHRHIQNQRETNRPEDGSNHLDGKLGSHLDNESSPNAIYRHILNLESRIGQITHSHDMLKNETDALKYILSRQHTAMQDITDILLKLTRNSNMNPFIEEIDKVKRQVTGLQESIQYNSRPILRTSMALATSLSTSTTPNSSTTSPSSSDMENSNSRNVTARFDTGNHHRTPGSSSNSSRNNDSDNEIPASRTSHDRIPIHSILSTEQQSAREEGYTSPPPRGREKGKRLPSIDMVYMGSLPSMEHPHNYQHQSHDSQQHHQQQHYQPLHYPHSSPPSSNPISPMEYHRSLVSLQPMRMPFESNDRRSSSSGSTMTIESRETVLYESAPTVASLFDTRSTSSYMGLGKESALLNHGPLERRIYDLGNTSPSKRRRSDH